MAFNVSLGNPGSAFSSPSSSVRRQRHRGPADKEKSRQRAAAHQAAADGREPEASAGHQETLGRATSPPATDPVPPPPAPPIISPLSIPTTSTTVPVVTPTFATVAARSEKVFNCDLCTAVLDNEDTQSKHSHHVLPQPCAFNAPVQNHVLPPKGSLPLQCSTTTCVQVMSQDNGMDSHQDKVQQALAARVQLLCLYRCSWTLHSNHTDISTSQLTVKNQY